MMHDPKLIEAMARAFCDEWGYVWEGDPDDGQTAPDLPADAYDDRPTKELYRKAATAALTALCTLRPDVAAVLRGEAEPARMVPERLIGAAMHLARKHDAVNVHAALSAIMGMDTTKQETPDAR